MNTLRDLLISALLSGVYEGYLLSLNHATSSLVTGMALIESYNLLAPILDRLYYEYL